MLRKSRRETDARRERIIYHSSLWRVDLPFSIVVNMSGGLPKVVQRYFLSFESSVAIIISKRQISACILACSTIIEVRWRVLNLVDRKQVHLWTLYVCFYTCSHITFAQVVLKCYRHACSRNHRWVYWKCCGVMTALRNATSSHAPSTLVCARHEEDELQSQEIVCFIYKRLSIQVNSK